MESIYSEIHGILDAFTSGSIEQEDAIAQVVATLVAYGASSEQANEVAPKIVAGDSTPEEAVESCGLLTSCGKDPFAGTQMAAKGKIQSDGVTADGYEIEGLSQEQVDVLKEKAKTALSGGKDFIDLLDDLRKEGIVTDENKDAYMKALELLEGEITSLVKINRSSSVADKNTKVASATNRQAIDLIKSLFDAKKLNADEAKAKIVEVCEFTPEEAEKEIASWLSGVQAGTKKIQSEAIPTAEENATDIEDRVFIPEASGLDTPTEGIVIEPDNGVTESEETPTSGSVEQGEQDAPAASSQIGGENGTTGEPAAEAFAMTGDQGVITIEGTAGEEFNDTGYSFDKDEIAALEVPIEESNNVQVIELAEIGSGVYVLKSSYIRKNAGRVTSFRTGKAARDFLYSGAKPRFVKSALQANLNGKVIFLPSSKQGVIFQSSNILGLIGVKAPIVRGLANAKYSVFALKQGHLVNHQGFELTSSAHNRVIASVTSNRAVIKGDKVRNLFQEVELGYVRYLQSKAQKAIADKNLIRSSYEARLTSLKKVSQQAIVQSRTEIDRYKNELRSQVSSLSALKSSVLQVQQNEIAGRNRELIASQTMLESSQSKENVEKLARMMEGL